MKKKIIVTGGLGYIGSHVCLELIKSGHTPIVMDNMENSEISTYNALCEINKEPIQLHRLDLRNQSGLKTALKVTEYDAVIHTAGYKDGTESVYNPQKYFLNNIGSTLNIIDLCKKPIVFSSSASIYGDQEGLSAKENSPVRPKTQYGYSKLIAEDMFIKMNGVVILRYFNVIGNDDYQKFGELKNPKVKNVLQHLYDSAWNVETFTINGNQYSSVDGTPIRDFIDVRDLAKAHVKAVEKVIEHSDGVKIYNVGTGSGVTILELAEMVDTLTGVKYEIGSPKSIDIERSVADISLIHDELGWQPEIPIDMSIYSGWKRYQHVNK